MRKERRRKRAWKETSEYSINPEGVRDVKEKNKTKHVSKLAISLYTTYH